MSHVTFHMSRKYLEGPSSMGLPRLVFKFECFGKHPTLASVLARTFSAPLHWQDMCYVKYYVVQHCHMKWCVMRHCSVQSSTAVFIAVVCSAELHCNIAECWGLFSWHELCSSKAGWPCAGLRAEEMSALSALTLVGCQHFQHSPWWDVSIVSTHLGGMSAFSAFNGSDILL